MYRYVGNYRARSRHIDVRKYFVHELVKEKVLKHTPCGTTDMMADALMKSLACPSFKIHRGTILDASSLHSRTSWTWT